MVKNNKFNLVLIGVFNIIHASSHLLQFLQSILLASVTLEKHEDDGLLEQILHNPYVNIIWFIIGISSLYIGIKEWRHHRKCEHHH